MTARRLLNLTVFAPIERNAGADRILAVLFHRSAATVYFIYAVWGVVSFRGIIPSILFTQGTFFQQLFSVAMVVAAVTGCVGATFFPKTGRTELFAGLAVASLLTYYVITLFFVGFGLADLPMDVAKQAAAIYGASHLVLPIARSVFIFRTLIRTANGVPR